MVNDPGLICPSSTLFVSAGGDQGWWACMLSAPKVRINEFGIEIVSCSMSPSSYCSLQEFPVTWALVHLNRSHVALANPTAVLGNPRLSEWLRFCMKLTSCVFRDT